ncbi:MAG: response regulator [Geobacter sp.]|nr:response regulator [Geobacter sp.]
MFEPLRLLHLEDNPADGELVRATLEEVWPEIVVERVDAEATFIDALERERIDLILADFSLPLYDGMSALALARQRFPQIPFIFVSGTLGEEKAIDSMRCGATDYVLKNRLNRLVPAVRRALKEKRELCERQRAEEALRESNERFRMIFENSIDAIMLTRIDGGIIAANPEACRIFGMTEEEICGAGRSRLVDMDDARAAMLLEERKKTGRCRGELTMIRGDGSRFPAEISSAVFSDREGEQKTSLVIRDVTGRKNLEHQLFQSQKMEAVGTLAGGIAHDFNNIVTAMIGYCTILQMEEQLSGKIPHYVDSLMALSERAANLTRGLLAFSRHQVMNPRLLNLNDIVATITTLICRLVGEHITIETHLSASSLFLMADYGQIEQILMNLATNAHDAMPDGGTLVISTDAVMLEPGNPLLSDSDAHGPYALLSVTDTGCGMDEATVARGFEPFFTTKEPGKGTGLGLSILYGIVKQHHGFVRVASRPGSGATFSIYFPLADATEAVDREKRLLPIRGGTETILVVEDEPAIRQVMSHILQQFGYQVLEAADGEEGTDLFRSCAPEIALVILDTILPRKHGRAVHEDIVLMKPDMKTLFVSGYPVDIIAKKGLLPDGVVFLPKPVSPMELLRTVRQLLDGQLHANESPGKRDGYAQ